MSARGTKRAPHRAERRRHPPPGSAAKVRRRRPAFDVAADRRARVRPGVAPPPARDPRAPHTGPQRLATPTGRTATPKTARQAKARAKARKAKTPKVIRRSLRERLILRLSSLDLRPHALIGKVPFVVLIIGILGVGLGITLWLSTDAAARSYQLGHIREQNRALMRQKEALERDVRTAESAPALAEAARELGMIPTRDTAHLIQDPAGNWVVIGEAKPAEGVPLPPLNTKLPDEQPAPRAVTPASPPEVPVRLPTNRPAREATPGRQPSQVRVPAPQGGVLMLPSVPIGEPVPDGVVPPAGVAPSADALPPAVPNPAAPPPGEPDPVAHPIDGVPIPPGPPVPAVAAQPLLPPAFPPPGIDPSDATVPPPAADHLPPEPAGDTPR